MASPTPDEATQIDQLGPDRNWFMPEMNDNAYQTLLSYMNGYLALATAVDTIATPIDRAYSNPVDPEVAEAAMAAGEHVSAEGELWDLWYAVLHTSKRHSWREPNAHDRLFAFVQALKARPDPSPPKSLPDEVRGNWIYTSGALWSALSMLGPSVRESWNDQPHAKETTPQAEIHAWTNMNAFVAKLTGEGIADFVTYSGWMIKEMADPVAWKHEGVSEGKRLDVAVPPAAVWILQAGRRVRDHVASPSEDYSIKSTFWEERWVPAKKIFGEVAERNDVLNETREIAAEAFARMEELENLREYE